MGDSPDSNAIRVQAAHRRTTVHCQRLPPVGRTAQRKNRAQKSERSGDSPTAWPRQEPYALCSNETTPNRPAMHPVRTKGGILTQTRALAIDGEAEQGMGRRRRRGCTQQHSRDTVNQSVRNGWSTDSETQNAPTHGRRRCWYWMLRSRFLTAPTAAQSRSGTEFSEG